MLNSSSYSMVTGSKDCPRPEGPGQGQEQGQGQAQGQGQEQKQGQRQGHGHGDGQGQGQGQQPVFASNGKYDADADLENDEHFFRKLTKNVACRHLLGLDVSSDCKSTQSVLFVTTASFFTFVVAVWFGAIFSHSLALLADAAAMSVDVITYALNMVAENLKGRMRAKHVGPGPAPPLPPRTRFIIDVVVPCCSVLALLGTGAWIAHRAYGVLTASAEPQPQAAEAEGEAEADDEEDVNVGTLYVFSSINLFVDLLSVWMFYRKGQGVFENEDEALAADSAPLLSPSSSPSTDDVQLVSGSLASGGFASVGASDAGADAREEPEKQGASCRTRNASGSALVGSSGASGHYREAFSASACASASASAADVRVDVDVDAETGSDQDRVAAATAASANLSASAFNSSAASGRQSPSPSAIKLKNLNMMTAFLHVGADTIRTVAVFAAAAVASSGQDSALCDAWAAVLCTITVAFIVVPVLKEVRTNALALWPLMWVGAYECEQLQEQGTFMEKSSLTTYNSRSLSHSYKQTRSESQVDLLAMAPRPAQGGLGDLGGGDVRGT
jgi:Co/Zn/Cd efflux system component